MGSIHKYYRGKIPERHAPIRQDSVRASSAARNRDVGVGPKETVVGEVSLPVCRSQNIGNIKVLPLGAAAAGITDVRFCSDDLRKGDIS